MTRTNVELEALVDTNDAWIRERTGIRERRIAPEGMVTSDMAAEAAKLALAAAELPASKLDLIVCATISPDMPMPATATFIQRKIGATCAAFDIGAACAGFIYGITIADQFIAGGGAKNVLVVGVELLSRVVNWSDRTTCVLFGDGAGAAVIGPAISKDRGILGTRLYSDGSLAESLMIPGGGSAEVMDEARVKGRRNTIHMKGQDIFKSAVRNLHSASQDLVDSLGLTNDAIDWVLPHQANTRIIDQVVARAQYPKHKVLTNIERVGNTSSASIPILLDERVRDGTIKPGDLVLTCALGAGLSWGAGLIRM